MDKVRRKFIKESVYGILALLGLGFLLSSIKLISPISKGEKQLVFFPLLAEDDVPRAGVKKTELLFSRAGRNRKTRVFVVSAPDGPLVFSATCSHLGCLVNYRKDRQ